MSVSKIIIALTLTAILLPAANFASPTMPLATQLGWIPDPAYQCGGYYLEPPFVYSVNVDKNNSVEITSNQTLFAQHGTSILDGSVTVTRSGQQLTANKAFLYRDPTTGKLNAMDLVGNVHLREPNTLVIAKEGHYNFESRAKSLTTIIYRTALNGREIVGPKVPKAEIQKERKVTALNAWGNAYEFSQTEPKIYEMANASFSTCPPEHPAWHVKATHLVLNKNTGRGYATNARILVKNVPIFYSPYFSFPLDRQRKSGFLWPTFGTRWGPYIVTPFYWDMAPNYDMTIAPGILSKRGIQLTDDFRYLTQTGTGHISFSVLPNDRLFNEFQDSATGKYGSSDNSNTQSELRRLLDDSTTRRAFLWRDDSRFNDHWSSHVDLNYAGDDYYLRDFGNNLNEITQNQLLQEADLYYKGSNWNFTGRAQAYQTLHPIDSPFVLNQYRRFPQLLLNGDFPDQPLGLEFFVANEMTHFEILNSPGNTTDSPIGNRINVQPGMSLPIYKPYFYVNPRVQIALTDYNLYQNTDTGTPKSIHRAVPIFDLASGIYLNRDFNFFSYAFQQTLEPQIYYTYIPYRPQSDIPVFDTTVNTLTYDQLFNYNRFSGIDRIGDANQMGVGVTTRLIDKRSGLEKIRLGVGEIMYFANRNVTLCDDTSCTDNPTNHSNYQRFSPLSGILSYNVNPTWNMTANSIWDPVQKQVNNSTVNLHYQTDNAHIANLGFSYVRNGDIASGIVINDSSNNLKLTDLSFSWPIANDINALGRWSQDWNRDHFQNLLYGVQYDTCCWSVRLVGSRTFTNLAPDTNTPQYDTIYYIQFNLKGLGNIGSGNPNSLLSSINGYNTAFGQDI